MDPLALLKAKYPKEMLVPRAPWLGYTYPHLERLISEDGLYRLSIGRHSSPPMEFHYARNSTSEPFVLIGIL